MLRSTRYFSTAASGVKLTSREASGNLSTLSVVVKNAGSKDGKSGVAHLLSKFNFLNTGAKSALRFTRESELLGGVFSSTVGRDATVLKTSFLKQDLPYYVEALGNVLTNTSYRPHELKEVVLPAALAESAAAHGSNAFTALEALHEVSFRRGLGQPLYYDGTTKISVDEIAEFASKAYNTSAVSIHASGVNGEDLAKFVEESAFSALASGASSSPSVESFTGKEARIRASGESVALIGIPVKPADFGKYEVLSAAIGNSQLPGVSTPLAKIPGATSFLYKYQDAGLFVVSVSGSGVNVAQGIKEAKKALSVSDSALTEATKAAELSVALQSTFEAPLSVKVEAGKAPVSEFNYVAIGDVDYLPYANEL
ncbi:ubiquinol-cytochrome-c reductase complex core protein 2 mitochondrial precursor [Suhomyces tanzawaensis NRRL Y-17324]|uniref:Cytochrome b-c1 complex subunit 2, mitochondrial n=1 Tax=Suhomyces tanzawaensis NRRL Y-17324 TaxID=984487 RepID=A0A1E4SI29_9ASCO|nr:ubiquinol-cytochrome-c reductase complex core protein 2 mitochondrial precursor [Suhomyces tanzawaensis NRRL Y-17324]ODV79155.1 ubiquinol-cytochrome-c reductase complex core protein 2 mitochondrial precursor [Suhomyces tanzawaensis NRRL Y-17324]